MIPMLLAQVGSGRIQGGWGYVVASYVIAYGAIGLYGLSLWLRTRAAEAQKRDRP